MKYLIVGGVAGGASVATRLRCLDEQAEILLSNVENTCRMPIADFRITSEVQFLTGKSCLCKLPGLNVIKKRVKPPVEKDFLGRIFGWMLPAHSGQLKLSKLNLFGAGGRMMRFIMKKKHIDSLEQLMQHAIANDVEMIACTMSMDVMGVQREELLDHVTLGGVASYLERTEEANLNLFI